MIDKFKQSFLEEAREIVVELEAALLALNQSPGDKEIVGRAFRALHTIKGSGSMFGFDELAAFTHNLENAFDEVRNGKLLVTPQLINLSLGALDQIKAMLDEACGEATVDRAISAVILEKLKELTSGVQAPAAASGDVLSEAKAPVPAQDGGKDASVLDLGSEWHIRFAPGPDLMRRGADPLLLLRELRQLGKLRITASLAAIPPIRELDPERCYMSWEMVLTTTATREVISDVFIFVADACELSIEAASQPTSQETTETGASVISPATSELTAAVTPVKPEAVAQPAARPPAAGIDLKLESNSAGSAPAKTAAKAAAPPGENPAAAAAAKAEDKKKSPPWGRRQSDIPDNATSIRVPAAKLDQFVNLVGELVTVQARLLEIATRKEDPEVVAVSEEIERLTSALREGSISIRMLPIRATFERFRRLVHDLARDLHKEVELTTEGADTELDKSVIDELNDPLMHLIRNSMDHGIETAERRVAVGKRPSATIQLSARYSGASVLICIADDGGGINAAAVRERAIEKGLVAPDAQLTEAEIFSLILAPGFSTAKEITDVSGRGVGMDVVRRKVEALRGSIDIASKPGAGTTVTLRLPLTLAIIDGLLVRVGQAYFVLPLATTLECIELTRQDTAKANGKHVVNVRGKIIPYIRLREYFDMRSEAPEREQVMIAETEDGLFGFVVDQVLGDHQTVIKNLGRFYKHVEMISGATILGNGSVALILDPQRLVRDAVRTMGHGHGVDARAAPQRRAEAATV
ncbi:MAG: chemotaxis protein CheA [Candidatus Sulfotelmatobacter sp.]|jgi:two-component system chemotaxis sensor kinase CheA